MEAAMIKTKKEFSESLKLGKVHCRTGSLFEAR
jgi:hypothetical protein